MQELLASSCYCQCSVVRCVPHCGPWLQCFACCCFYFHTAVVSNSLSCLIVAYFAISGCCVPYESLVPVQLSLSESEPTFA